MEKGGSNKITYITDSDKYTTHKQFKDTCTSKNLTLSVTFEN